MTRLEPRTQHQPGKLQKLSKNECVSTLFAKEVKAFGQENISCIFNAVQAVHRLLPKNGAIVIGEVGREIAPAAYLARARAIGSAEFAGRALLTM